jgi:hypothetical protein
VRDEDRQVIIGILRKHGHESFTKDLGVVRFAGSGRFGEHIAVHPYEGQYILFVRRGGWKYVEPIQAVMGGDRGPDGGNALAFSGLDLVQLESKLKQLVTTVERVC